MNSQILSLFKARCLKVNKSSCLAYSKAARRCSSQVNQFRQFHSTIIPRLDDPYKTLGVDKSATASQIKKAYYKLAKKFHPDVNQEKGADEKFHSLQEAYDILSDPKKKEQYDQFGPAAFSQGAGGPGAGGYGGGHPYGGGNPFAGFGGFGGFGGRAQGGGGNPFEGINFEDLFGGFTGGGGGGRRGGGFQHYQGEDIEILKTIPFKESVFGTRVKVNYSAVVQCKGVPVSDMSSNRGSLKVILNVKTMRPTNATQIALLEAVADAFGDKTAKRLDPEWKPFEDSVRGSTSTGTTDDDKDASNCEHPNNLKRINNFLNNAFKKILGEKGEKDDGNDAAGKDSKKN
ncbi:hypothetical protein PMKS-003010 [Pichia membranifaciens]|uniref:J domain-containing protein n=1 Tax=Pichia membranifaciens TaxID=4926 RepID=A0A1Q2YIY9_9ASCO|nr:hypothetical protein PMKS-003010 [Pichia membranifaciens]